MTSIWNFQEPLRLGSIRLAKAGKEKYGTVIKSGYMNKTVTVRVDQYNYNRRYKVVLRSSSKFQVHDEDNICKMGDKVVIRVCQPLSKLKHYYIRNIVWMVPRHNFTIDSFLNFEKRALLYNKNLRDSIDIQSFPDSHKI